MKNLCLGLLLTLAAACAWADPVEGYWLSVDDKTGKVTAGWEFYIQNGLLYGRMVSLVDYPADAVARRCKESYRGFPLPGKVNDMKVMGTPWIFGLRSEAPGRWVDGHIINPEDGLMWQAKVRFHPADGKRFKTDTLEMRGEIGLGLGRSQYWPKATEEEAKALR